jgi:mitochondrial fission protein ELM1
MIDAPSRSTPDTCWVMTDGKAGMEVQCVGLAEALGFEPRVKRIQVTKPWRWLPPRLVPDPLGAIGPKRDRLAPPWPEMLIASGRQTVAPAMAIRHASGGRTFTVQIQNPVVDPARFDLVVAPRHDRLTGPNVIQTIGGLNRITEARLRAAAAKFGPAFAHLPRPLIAVALGGSNRAYRFTRAIARRLGEDLARLCRAEGVGLLITASRRTDPSIVALLRAALNGCAAEIWDGEAENPYLGYLALAEAFVVTGDSVNMVCEAATTGKPADRPSSRASTGRCGRPARPAPSRAGWNIGATRPCATPKTPRPRSGAGWQRARNRNRAAGSRSI